MSLLVVMSSSFATLRCVAVFLAEAKLVEAAGPLPAAALALLPLFAADLDAAVTPAAAEAGGPPGGRVSGVGEGLAEAAAEDAREEEVAKPRGGLAEGSAVVGGPRTAPTPPATLDGTVVVALVVTEGAGCEAGAGGGGSPADGVNCCCCCCCIVK